MYVNIGTGQKRRTFNVIEALVVDGCCSDDPFECMVDTSEPNPLRDLNLWQRASADG